MNLILTFGNPPHNDLIRHPPSGPDGSWGFTKRKILVKINSTIRKETHHVVSKVKHLGSHKLFINTSCCTKGVAMIPQITYTSYSAGR